MILSDFNVLCLFVVGMQSWQTIDFDLECERDEVLPIPEVNAQHKEEDTNSTTNFSSEADDNKIPQLSTCLQMESKSTGENGKYFSKKGFDPDEESSDDDDHDHGNPKCCQAFTVFRSSVHFCSKARCELILRSVIVLVYLAVFCFAMYHRFGDEGSIRLLALTLIGILVALRHVLAKKNLKLPSPVKWGKSLFMRRLLYAAMTIFAVVYIVLEVGMKQPYNLVSLAGMVTLLACCLMCSRNFSRIDWHCIFWAISSQFLLAIILIKTTWGILVISWMADRVTSFMENGYKASAFVFGKTYKDHRVILASLPLLFLVNSTIAILYHLGIMQCIIKGIGKILTSVLNTTPAESLSVAANMFLGSIQSALVVKPYLHSMSRSELFALMVGGFASVSGSVFGIFIGFGAPARHLLTACIMSAPASFAVSKLLVPESRASKRKRTTQTDSHLHLEHYKNIIDATGRGSVEALAVFSSVVVNLYVFYALLQFLNSTLIWFGDRIGVENLSFQNIVSYIFLPLPLLMGADVKDCRSIAKLIGFKLMGTNGLAYIMLGKLRDNEQVLLDYTFKLKENSTWYYDGDNIVLSRWNRTLVDGVISDRSTVIATYAMCGFSNFASMGIMMGSMLALVPKRRGVVVNLIVKAMVAGNLACYLTACIAGLFYGTYPD